MVAAVATVAMAGELAAGLLTEVSTSPRLPGRREGWRLSCLMGQAPLGLALNRTTTTTTICGRTPGCERIGGGMAGLRRTDRVPVKPVAPVAEVVQ